MTLDRYEGCLLGLALGDALGAPFEGGLLERLAWRAIGRTRDGRMRWTDDTQMAIDLAESLLANRRVDPDDLAQRFARSYHWSRGYGPGAARMLKRIKRGADWRQTNRSVWPEGSFGNGGAMRAPVVGMYYAQALDELDASAEQAAAVTHAHPSAREGASLLARATASALRGDLALEILREAGARCALEDYRQRLATAEEWLERREGVAATEVARALGNSTAASASCVSALYVALRFMNEEFLAMQAFIVRCGGDVDTIGAMAGAIWGAANGVGKLPGDKLARLESRERVEKLAGRLYAARK